MSDGELRYRIESVIEEADQQWEFEFAASNESGSAYVDPGPKGAYVAQAVIDDLQLSAIEIPGGISDYSPFTGKPIVQPDRWCVESERVFVRVPEKPSAPVSGSPAEGSEAEGEVRVAE